MTTPNEPVVVYTVKEMLTRIEGKLDSFNASQVIRMDSFDLRLQALEGEWKGRKLLSDKARWIVAAVASVAGAAAAIVAVIYP
jgi:hypothetical protein